MNAQTEYQFERIATASRKLCEEIASLPAKTGQLRQANRLLRAQFAASSADATMDMWDARQDLERAEAEYLAEQALASSSAKSLRALQFWLRACDQRALALRPEARLAMLALVSLLALNRAANGGCTVESLDYLNWSRDLYRFAPAAFEALANGAPARAVAEFLRRCEQCEQGEHLAPPAYAQSSEVPPVRCSELGYSDDNLGRAHYSEAAMAARRFKHAGGAQ